MASTKPDASFPVAPTKSELPQNYAEFLSDIKKRVERERIKAVLSVNSAMVLLYWDIGKEILENQKKAGWGSKVIDRLAHDLHQAFPDMTGFSPRNLLFMRAFSEAYPDMAIVKQLVSLIPWGHIVRLMQIIKDQKTRDWYIQETIKNGWSRSILELQIERGLHKRQGQILHNFKAVLPPAESDMAAQAFKDPYLFDFVGTAGRRREKEVEQALVDHVQKFLLELGAGFAFVGRQVPLQVGSQDFRIDLLFYHLRLRCYVVIELKAVRFDPAFVGKVNFYLSAVDDLLRHPDDKPTIGLLLCRNKDHIVVEYALRDLKKPVGVAGWETMLVETLPNELKGSLPTIEQIEKEFGASV